MLLHILILLLVAVLAISPASGAEQFGDTMPFEVVRQLIIPPSGGEAHLYSDIPKEFPPFNLPAGFDVLACIDEGFQRRVILKTELGAAQDRYVLQCSRVSVANDWSGPEGNQVHYVVFITCPAALKLPSAGHLMNLYGITRAQSRVALVLASGAGNKEAARRLRVSEETVRSHVKQLYSKTGVNRQADLVRLVLTLSQNSV